MPLRFVQKKRFATGYWRANLVVKGMAEGALRDAQPAHRGLPSTFTRRYGRVAKLRGGDQAVGEIEGTLALPSLPAVRSDRNDPDPGGVSQAFGRIGYKLGDALADLVDNSIDAEASGVLIRLLRDEDAIRHVIVADDGYGMDDATLLHGMQFGARIEHKPGDLGKFGMGLKSASFSQCRNVAVLSRRNGLVCGRRWTLESIEQGWLCEFLEPKAVKAFLNSGWSPLDLSKHGTVVIWTDIDRLRVDKRGIEKAINKLVTSLVVHLGLVFHRFLSEDRLRIAIEAQNLATDTYGPLFDTKPLDPFGYTRSGKQGYPRDFEASLPRLPSLVLSAHIWPPRASDSNYRLGGGRVSARQGFYFYRNNRLIQAGGWNGWRESDSEPHTSLARVRVDLTPKFDSAFSLNVQKSGVDVPVAFLVALDSIKSGKTTFADYIGDADDTYRNNQGTDIMTFPILAGSGMPSSVRQSIRRAFAPNGKVARDIKFRWSRIDSDRLFEVDRETSEIRLNSLYRNAILRESRRFKSDAPLVKALLFLLLRSEFERERIRDAHQRTIDQINEVLLTAVQEQ